MCTYRYSLISMFVSDDSSNEPGIGWNRFKFSCSVSSMRTWSKQGGSDRPVGQAQQLAQPQDLGPDAVAGGGRRVACRVAGVPRRSGSEDAEQRRHQARRFVHGSSRGSACGRDPLQNGNGRGEGRRRLEHLQDVAQPGQQLHWVEALRFSRI